MKSTVFVFVAAGAMLLACNNNRKSDGKSVEKADTVNVDTVKADTATYNDPTGIVSIRKTWTSKTISVNAGKKTPDIKQLALAFCKTYPQCETNKAMMACLISPNAALKESYEIASNGTKGNFSYHIDCKPRNGYIRCIATVETAPLTIACLWNRNNGHKLFAANMENTHENMAYDERLVVFYDYDSTTDVMTPDAALTDMIEKRVKGYDFYSVILPEQGKDIEVWAFTIDKDSDTSESKEMKLKWNGMNFDWVD